MFISSVFYPPVQTKLPIVALYGILLQSAKQQLTLLDLSSFEWGRKNTTCFISPPSPPNEHNMVTPYKLTKATGLTNRLTGWSFSSLQKARTYDYCKGHNRSHR